MKKSVFLKTAILAAQKAGVLSHKYFNKKIKISYKDKNEIVTEVDQLCEKIIIKTISKKFPDHSFFCEESGESLKNKEFKWIIDPIDGTFMYSKGINTYGISIALEKNKTIICGVVLFPEMNKLYFSEKGKGSFLNNHKIKVSTQNHTKPLFLICSEMTRYPSLMKKLSCNNRKRDIYLKDFGSTTLHLCMVAEGKADACFAYNIKPFDIAAGILIVREAGGIIITPEGKPATFKDNKIIARSKKIKRTDLI